MSHFLQSRAWQVYQESIGRTAFNLDGDGWHVLVLKHHAHGITRLYAPYGPEVDTPAALEEAIRAIEDLGRAEKAVFLRLEPTGSGTQGEYAEGARETMEHLGYHGTKAVQPSDTWIIDLTQDEDVLLKDMGSTNRNLYRGTERRGLTVTTSTNAADIDHLSTILEQIAEGKSNFRPHDREYLRKQAESLFAQGAARLFLVRHDGHVIAASLAYEGDGVIYYAHSGASTEYRKLRAGQVLVAHMLFDAQHRGMHEFDLYGIAPNDDPQHPWAGFTSFKKSFGGSARHYSGTWEKPLKQARYALYRTAREVVETLSPTV